jgi:glycosyltransferase involved in cell wall biosynthesis
MTEVHSFLISFLTFARKIPHYLWYAHASKSLYLVVCHRLLSSIITSTSGSCPINDRKVIAIGQGVNEQTFHSSHVGAKIVDFPSNHKLRVVHVGRIDPSKNINLLIDLALRSNNSDYIHDLVLVGSPTINHHEFYSQLLAKHSDLVMAKRLRFAGNVKRQDLPEYLIEFDFFFHAFDGSLDKTLIEATMAGLAVVTSNLEYRKEFGTWSEIKEGPFIDLKRELDSFIKLASNENSRVLAELRRRGRIASEKHSLDQWITRIVAILKEDK